MTQRTLFIVDTCAPDKPQLGNRSRSNYNTTIASTVTYDTLYIQLPASFIQSHNPKKTIDIRFVRVINVAEDNGNDVLNGSAHTDAIQHDATADHYLCAVNIPYACGDNMCIISDNKSTVEVWIRDGAGNIVDLDPTLTRVILECWLTW